MRLASLLLSIGFFTATAAFADDPAPITPEEAAKKINEKVVVKMEVKSTGGKNNHYLNSEADFTSPKNFTIFISKDLLEKFKKAGVENPSEFYKGKLIQVTGKVTLENQKPWLKVEGPDLITVLPKEDK
jgi:DNA/RNA endonuclease YhcR with UshA esterase domain